MKIVTVSKSIPTLWHCYWLRCLFDSSFVRFRAVIIIFSGRLGDLGNIIFVNVIFGWFLNTFYVLQFSCNAGGNPKYYSKECSKERLLELINAYNFLFYHAWKLAAENNNGVNQQKRIGCSNAWRIPLECVRSCDQKPYLHNERKGGICIKVEFNPQNNISLLQDGYRFFVYSSIMTAVTSCQHTLYIHFCPMFAL